MRVDREVHERPLGEDQVVRVAVGAVLRHRVLDGLVRQRVLQLRRGDRDAVDDEGQVERVGRVGLGVVQLADDAAAVGRRSAPAARGSGCWPASTSTSAR